MCATIIQMLRNVASRVWLRMLCVPGSLSAHPEPGVEAN